MLFVVPSVQLTLLKPLLNKLCFTDIEALAPKQWCLGFWKQICLQSCSLFLADFTQMYLLHSQNFNIYKRLFLDVINLPDADAPESYRTWADLRSFLLQLVTPAPRTSWLTRRHRRLTCVCLFSVTTCPSRPRPTRPLIRTSSRCCSSLTTTPRDRRRAGSSSWCVDDSGAEQTNPRAPL